MKNRIIPILFLLLGIISCMEEQDFDQADDIGANPVIEASILYIESPENLLNQTTTSDFYSREFNFDGFSEDIFADRVLDGTIFYELENTTSKELEVTVEFLDEAGEPLDLQIFHIDPAPTAVLKVEVAYGSGSGRSIEIIKNTSGIRVGVQNLGDNISVSTLPDPKIIFRSSGKFRMRLR